jgi:repressor LexA
MDGENTLKRLIKKGTKYFLKAENPLYPDLEPVETLAVQGVLVGVVRTFA